MPLAIRLAEETDLAAMALLRANEPADRAFWTDRIRRYLRGEHAPQHALAEREIFVAEEEAQVVGFVAGQRTQRFDCDGELQWINVAAERRGRGIATQLIERLGVWFVEQGARRICVNVDARNTAARALYARCGARDWQAGWMLWEDATEMRAH